MLADFQRTIEHYIPEDRTLQNVSSNEEREKFQEKRSVYSIER
jgi:hypothetical protein